MTALLIDPHGDDLALFCCYTALREKPHVMVTHRTVPIEEIDAAMEVLDCSWSAQATPRGHSGLLIGPCFDEAGHEDHNDAGVWVSLHSGEKMRYLTYAPRGHRSVWGIEVVPSAEEIALKLRALACFESQIENPATRPWFFQLLDLREWVA